MSKMKNAPLISPEDKQPDEELKVKLRPEVASELRAYAQYADNSSLHHVISEALKRLFREDKGFKIFKDENRAAAAVPVAASEASERGSRKPKTEASAA